MRRFQNIYSFYSDAMVNDVSAYEADPSKLVLPVLPFAQLHQVMKFAAAAFMKEETVLNINDDLIIVGDLHGQILDLLRILNEFGAPPKTKYLFLGDYVDRGQFSTETCILLLTMKVLWPSSVFMIRGNHEFSQMWNQGGFISELEGLYPDENAASEFEKAFSVMPLAAIVNRKVICVHGGIGPKVTDITTIAALKRPIRFFQGDVVADVLWSDPAEETEEFTPSPRHIGQLFGETALTRFLANSQMELLVRGHESQDEGYAYQFHCKVLTVFSASRYCNVLKNKGGVLIAKRLLGIPLIPQTFRPLKWILRSEVSFKKTTDRRSLLVNIKKEDAIQAVTPRRSATGLSSAPVIVATPAVRRPSSPAPAVGQMSE